MKGCFYGVSVGPGDPELLTRKAERVILAAPVLAVPTYGAGGRLALEIVKNAGLELSGKEILSLELPMTRDAARLARGRQAAAAQVAGRLEAGRSVAFLTLGDVTVYSTYLYLERLVRQAGYDTEMVPGVSSFCAAAARLGVGLCEGAEALHVIPASYEGTREALDWPGAKVLMKTGRSLPELKRLLEEKRLTGRASLVERCGLEGERVYPCLADAPEDAGYFSVVLVRGREEKA